MFVIKEMEFAKGSQPWKSLYNVMMLNHWLVHAVEIVNRLSFSGHFRCIASINKNIKL